MKKRMSFNNFSDFMDEKLKNIPLTKIKKMCQDFIKGDKSIPSIKTMDRTQMMSYIVSTTSLIVNKRSYPVESLLKDLKLKYKINLK